MKSVIGYGLAGVLLLTVLAHSAQAEPRSYIRFYKANKKLQEDRIMFARKKGMQEGCHNFLKKARLHRINQIGFKQCQIFEEKNCNQKSLLTVQDEDNTHSPIITQGISWYPSGKDERGKKIGSWHCKKS